MYDSYIKTCFVFLVLGCVCAHLNVLYAQKTKHYPIEDLIRIAESNYRPVAIKKIEIEQKKELARHEKQWENPVAGVSLGGKINDGETGMEYSVTLDQKIPASGKKRIASAMATLEEKEARIALDEMKLALRYEITRLAFAYARDLARAEHVLERLKRIKLINAHMQGHILIPPQRIVERNIVREKLSRMEMEYLESRKCLAMSYNALNQYLKFPAGASFTVGLSWFSRAPELNFDDLLSRAMLENFDIRYQEAVTARAEQAVKLARKDLLPEIGFGLYYGADTMKKKEQTFGGGATIPIPVLNQNRHAIRKESLNNESQQLATVHLREKVKLRIEDLQAEYEYVRGMIALFPVSRLRTLEKKMDYADAEFRKGRVPLVAYLEMDASIHESMKSIYETQLLLVRVYTDLLFMAGIMKEVPGEAQ